MGSVRPLPLAMSNLKGVIRIDSQSTHGWQVRVYRFGKTFSKLFSDRKSGGREAALAAALAYQGRLDAEVWSLPQGAPRRRLVRAGRSASTPAIGISRTVKRDRRGVPHEVYVVSWNPEPGVGRGTSFSIRRYGEDGAFERACALRWAKMREIHGDRYAVACPTELYPLKDAVDARCRARTGGD